MLLFSLKQSAKKDDAICAKKGWHPFELFALEPEKLKEAIG